MSPSVSWLLLYIKFSISTKPLYTIVIVSYIMKRVLLVVLLFVTLCPLQEGGNITQEAVYLHERVIAVKFVNMGVDAYWGEHILENATAALPVLEDLIGVPLPEEVKSVEIYGKRNLGAAEWAVGYNDGNIVALKKDHPLPTYVFHELIHFWTIYYKVPWPLVEGYCDLYADLCAIELGLTEVAPPEIDWEHYYSILKTHSGKVPLNGFSYHAPGATEDKIEYLYIASYILMHQFYETVGKENLQEINQKMAESSLDERVGGFGIVQYLIIAKEVTGVNYAGLFMPVILVEWEPGHVTAFEQAVGRYHAVSIVTGYDTTKEEMRVALNNLVKAQFPEFQNQMNTILTAYYEQKKLEEELPEFEIIAPPKKRGFFDNKLLLFGIVMLVVGMILLIVILSKLAKEEETFEWEAPRRRESELRIPPPESVEEPAEELPETDFDEFRDMVS